MSRIKLSLFSAAAVILAATFAFAQPARNVSAARHPNLNAAQKFSQQAYEKITAAQQANEFDLKGHGAKAKQLLEEANNEMKQAAEAANRK